jgi:hypothetical protein
VLVDEAVFHQGLRQHAAPDHQEVLSGLLLSFATSPVTSPLRSGEFCQESGSLIDLDDICEGIRRRRDRIFCGLPSASEPRRSRT